MKAVLVGPIQQENLALGYLAAYARTKGHDVTLVAYAERSELSACVDRILAEAPDLVGLGIAFQNNVEEYVLLLREIRARGYRGHLTCGGHVGTFCYEELLSELPGLDSVVRHDGEETLVDMLDALGRGEAPSGIAGLVWREGDAIAKGSVRAAAADLDALPWPKRSHPPYTVGGIIVDFLITARGCVGECSYCSIAAYTSEQRRSYRLRSPEAVSEEVAFAYHERGARVFFVQDDLFVLPGERAAVARMNRIRDGIEERGVKGAVFWIKGRPENITPAVAAAAREMGAIHMFLGVENASAKRLRYLGRTHLPLHNDSAIANSRAAGIVPSFNFMLFDPDSTLDDAELTLDLAEQHLDLPWNVCRTEVYSGTALKTRLEAEGRLQGTWRSYGYRMRDERAEVMFRILRVSLHERALALGSLLNRLISLSFARQLHETLLPSGTTERLAAEAHALGVTVRRDTVQRLRQILAFVRDRTPSATDARRFAVAQALDIGATDMPLRVRTDQLWNELNDRGAALTRGVGTSARGGRSSFAVAAGS